MTLNPVSRDLTSFANAFMALKEVFHMQGSKMLNLDTIKAVLYSVNN